jgi:hypothetical protein
LESQIGRVQYHLRSVSDGKAFFKVYMAKEVMGKGIFNRTKSDYDMRQEFEQNETCRSSNGRNSLCHLNNLWLSHLQGNRVPKILPWRTSMELLKYTIAFDEKISSSKPTEGSRLLRVNAAPTHQFVRAPTHVANNL